METELKQAPKSRSPIVTTLVVLFAFVLAFAAVYAGFAYHYKTTFFPNTHIHGVNVSGKDLDQAQQALKQFHTLQTINLIGRNGESERLDINGIDFDILLDDTLERELSAQQTWRWGLSLFSQTDLDAPFVVSYSDAKLDKVIDSLSMLDSTNAIAPENAYLSEYNAETNSVSIVDDVQGTTLNREALKKAIEYVLRNLQTSLDLDEFGCYTAPEITRTDSQLLADQAALNNCYSMTLTYQIGEDTIELKGQDIADWFYLDENHTVQVKEEPATAYVRNLAQTYNTIFGTREFMTAYGQTVTVVKGDYGWWMDEPNEIAGLREQLATGVSGTREPLWRQTAVAHGEHDYGDTYVEVNLVSQHLFFFKDGQLVLESDVVTGKNDATTVGTYGITYKERYGTLRGDNYASPVSYWMPFNGNIGLHDASWRSAFGGTLYKSNGSHGCVNLPISVAKELYGYLSDNTPVIVYKLWGTESSSTTPQTDQEIAAVLNDALDDIESHLPITKDNYELMDKKIYWIGAEYKAMSAAPKQYLVRPERIDQFQKTLDAYQKANGMK